MLQPLHQTPSTSRIFSKHPYASFHPIMTDFLTSCRRRKRAISLMKTMETSPHGQHIPQLSYRHQTTANGGKRSASLYTVLCVETLLILRSRSYQTQLPAVSML